MPVYEYECGVCKCRFERRQRFDEEPIGICPQCQGKARRVLHSVPIFYKGSGFYSTDHGRGWQGTTQRKEEEKPTAKPTAKEGSSEDTAAKGQGKETTLAQ
jgi:putative FmdB family regulatory protein